VGEKVAAKFSETTAKFADDSKEVKAALKVSYYRLYSNLFYYRIVVGLILGTDERYGS
jgi:hypothetical protein